MAYKQEYPVIDSFVEKCGDISKYIDKIDNSGPTEKGLVFTRIASQHCIVELAEAAQNLLSDWIVIAIQRNPRHLVTHYNQIEPDPIEFSIKRVRAIIFPDIPSLGKIIPIDTIYSMLGGPHGNIPCHYRSDFEELRSILDGASCASASRLLNTDFFEYMELVNHLRNHQAHMSPSSEHRLNEYIFGDNFSNCPNEFKKTERNIRSSKSSVGTYLDKKIAHQYEFRNTRLGYIMGKLCEGIEHLHI